MWIWKKVQRKRGIGGGLVFLISTLSLWGAEAPASRFLSVFQKADRPKVQLFIQNLDKTREQLRRTTEEFFTSYELHRQKGAVLAAFLHERLVGEEGSDKSFSPPESRKDLKDDGAFLKRIRYVNAVYPLGLGTGDSPLSEEGMLQELYRLRTLRMDTARDWVKSSYPPGDTKTSVTARALEETLVREGTAFSRYLKPRIAKASKSVLLPLAEALETRLLSHPETPPFAFKRLREEAQKLKTPQYQEWILSLSGTSPRFLVSFAYSWGNVTGPEIDSFKKAYKEFQRTYEKAQTFRHILSAAAGLVWLIDEYEGFRGPDDRFWEDIRYALAQLRSLSLEDVDMVLQEYPSYRWAFLEVSSSLWLFLFRPMPGWILEKLGDAAAVSELRSWLFQVGGYTPRGAQEEQKRIPTPKDVSLTREDIETLERTALALVRAQDDVSRVEAMVPFLSQQKVLEYFMVGKGRTEEGKFLYQSMQRLLAAESPPAGLVNSSATMVLFMGDLLAGKPLRAELLALLYQQSGKGKGPMVFPYESYGSSLIREVCDRYGIPENLLVVGRGKEASFPWTEAVGALSLSGFRLAESFSLARREQR